MSLRPRLLALLAVLVALPAFASTHIWYGTTNDRMSEPSNWSGGAPASHDREAILIFAREAERFAIVNDIAVLQFREMRFEAPGFSISGLPMNPIISRIETVSDVTISNDLIVGGVLTLSGLDVVLSGAISGGGGLEMTRSTVTLTGATSNTYEGQTEVRSATLILSKTGGAIAVSGDLLMTRTISPPRVSVIHAEQIVDDAAVRIESGILTLVEDETFRNLEIGGTVARGGVGPVPLLTVQSIFTLSESSIRTDLRVAFVETEFATLAAGRAVIIPDSGIGLRGGGTVRWNSDTTATTRIEGVRAELEVPNSEVRMTSGVFQGKAASLTATGGKIDGAEIGSNLRLTAAATVLLAPIRLNGFLSLGGATLDLGDRSLASSPAILIDNASSQPVQGRFAGLPDGALVDNRYLINYRGGDGNDVELVDLHRPRATLTPSLQPEPAMVGEPVTLRVVVSGSRGTPTGTVRFSHFNGVVIGTAPIVDGVATLQVTFDDDVPNVMLYYSGDATYASESTEFFDLSFAWPRPVITSIEPSSGAPGEQVFVTVRGERFLPGVTLTGGTFTDLQYISPTELAALLHLSSFRSADMLVIRAVQVDDTASEGVPFAIVPRVDASSMLMFDEAGPFAHVSRGAKTAWLTSAEERSTFFAVDDDRDERVQWPLPNPHGIFAVVDLANGEFDVRATGGALREARAFPPHAFGRDLFALPIGFDLSADWRILWARPNVGAWHTSLTDGEDLDGLRNGLLFGSIASMIPLGDSPAHPNGFARGDVVIMMSPGAGLFASASSVYFAERLGELFDDTAPAVVQVVSRNYEFTENKTARVFVARTGGSGGVATVRYSTLSRSAVAGIDFVAKSGAIAFGPGEILKAIDIPLIDHGGYRGTASRLFHVVLSDATGAVLGENVSVVQIVSHDAPPTLTIVGPEHRQVRETDAQQPYTIELRLTGATELPASVHWSAGLQSGEVTFAVGEWRKSVTIVLPGDDVDGGTAFVKVEFHAVMNATLAGPREIEIEVLEDDAPVLTGFDLSVDETEDHAVVNFRLTPPTDAVYWYDTADGTATWADYVTRSDYLIFTERQSDQFARIPILNDFVLEGDETLTVRVNDVVATVTIRDDELTLAQRPVITIAPATVVEPIGTSAAAFEVTLSATSTFPISVHLVTQDNSATAGADYQFTDETLVFEPGETHKTFIVPIFGDMLAEEDETFAVRMLAMLNGQVGNYGTSGTILKNEPQPRRQRAVGH